MTVSRRSERAGGLPDATLDAPRPGRATRGGVLEIFGVFLALTVLAAGAGSFAGFQLSENVRAIVEKRAAEEEPATPNPDYVAGMTRYQVPAVVANLAAPPDVWIRIESSIVFSDTEIARPDILAAEIAEDMLAYLRTVSLAQIEGASGFLHLREDLSDRVAIRSNGSVRELIIETMVVQ